MNFEMVVIIGVIFISLNIIILMSGSISRLGRNIMLVIAWIAMLLFVFMVTYRLGFFGNIPYVDGIIHKAERPNPVKSVIPPKFESQKSSVWQDAKEEHRENVNNFTTP